MAEDQQDNTDNIQIIRGTPFPKSQRFTEKNIVDAMDLVPYDDDVIITSYPKTGTTWLQYIIIQILSKAEKFPSMSEASQKLVPFLEVYGTDALHSAPKPRLYKHHIPYNLVQKNSKSKVIYIYRNPEDTVVSYYNFRQSFFDDKCFDFEDFFDRFVSGNIEYGSYFDHVMSFYVHREDPNLLLVSYEKLHANPKEGILKIAKFLGEEHYKCLLENQDILNKIAENTSFESMRKNLQLTIPSQKSSDGSEEEKAQQRVITFFRKGIVGDGKNALTETQRQRIKEAVDIKMKDTIIAKEWL